MQNVHFRLPSVAEKRCMLKLPIIAIYCPLLSTLRGRSHLFQVCLPGDLTCNLCAKKDMPMDNQEWTIDLTVCICIEKLKKNTYKTSEWNVDLPETWEGGKEGRRETILGS